MDETDNPLGSLPPELANIIQLALTTFIKENLGSLYIMIIASLWLGISLSLFMALLYTSSSHSRRKPVFVLCVIAVAIGTIPSILVLKLFIQTFIGSENLAVNLAQSIKPYLFALAFFSFFASICVDSILLFRLVAVFPPSRLPRKELAAVFGPLLIIKLGRLAALVVFIVQYLKKTRTLPSDDPMNYFLIIRVMPEPKAIWSLQIIDNAVCSFLFMYRLNQIKSFSLRLSNASYAKRLRTLLLITVSNFVFPVIFAILELGLMNGATKEIALAGINISATNVEVVGVLFATIWASQEVDSWKKGQQTDAISDGGIENGISFATRPATFVSTRQTGAGSDYYAGQIATQGGTISTGMYSISEGSNADESEKRSASLA
ncbi:hypothetical protein VKT23_017726 [Stygiomarasmius scandens]|uniref:Uncharacterized protein n=1 Tax=Marasmiellus scandens TaxID=2682957 RepID=A0ABR1IRD2_9AGAR